MNDPHCRMKGPSESLDEGRGHTHSAGLCPHVLTAKAIYPPPSLALSLLMAGAIIYHSGRLGGGEKKIESFFADATVSITSNTAVVFFDLSTRGDEGVYPHEKQFAIFFFDLLFHDLFYEGN